VTRTCERLEEVTVDAWIAGAPKRAVTAYLASRDIPPVP
jgi:hypothetical protein